MAGCVWAVWVSGWSPLLATLCLPPHTALPSTLPPCHLCRARGNGLAVADSTATAQAVKGELAMAGGRMEAVQPFHSQPSSPVCQPTAWVAGQLLMPPVCLRHPTSLQAALPLLSLLPRPLPMAVWQLLALPPRPLLPATTPPPLPWPRCVHGVVGWAMWARGRETCHRKPVVAWKMMQRPRKLLCNPARSTPADHANSGSSLLLPLLHQPCRPPLVWQGTVWPLPTAWPPPCPLAAALPPPTARHWLRLSPPTPPRCALRWPLLMPPPLLPAGAPSPPRRPMPWRCATTVSMGRWQLQWLCTG